MLGRTFLVILFFWAALTIVTPILVHLSASAKLLDYNGETKNGGSQNSKMISLLSRKALGSMGRPPTERPVPEPGPAPAPAPAPSSKPHRQTTFEPEVSSDTRISGSTNLHPYQKGKSELEILSSARVQGANQVDQNNVFTRNQDR